VSENRSCYTDEINSHPSTRSRTGRGRHPHLEAYSEPDPRFRGSGQPLKIEEVVLNKPPGRDAIKQDVKPVCTTPNPDAALVALNAALIRLWRNARTDFVPFLIARRVEVLHRDAWFLLAGRRLGVSSIAGNDLGRDSTKGLSSDVALSVVSALPSYAHFHDHRSDGALIVFGCALVAVLVQP
jgi:hypothetical protein